MQRMWDSITEEIITMAQEKIQDFKKEEIDMMIAESITTGLIARDFDGMTTKMDMKVRAIKEDETGTMNNKISVKIAKSGCGITIIATQTLISWVNYYNLAKAINITRVG